MNYLEHLNKEQKEAVESTEGPLLILAGAGSGKTRVITYRILHLIASGKALPEEILAITFTNKAASEMKERVGELLKKHSYGSDNGGVPTPFISTFHALGVHVLRNHHKKLSLPKKFSIYDRSDSLKIIKKSLERLGFDTKTHDPKKIMNIISKHKGLGKTASDFTSERKQSSTPIGSVWALYEKALVEEGALDFDDLLLKTYKLLADHKEVVFLYQNLWKYIHIDEYQDTNHVQYKMAKLLAKNHKNICVVGDPDQNVYSWRGAQIENILNFQKDYEDISTITLAENYRSTKNILDLAEDAIDKNTMRLEKKVFTSNKEGARVGLYAAFDEKDEASYIADKCRSLLSEDKSETIGVLYRTHFQSRVLEEAFLAEGLPYQVLGVKFFERKEVKDVLSFLHAALNPKSQTYLSRIINVPPRGIGKMTLLRILSNKEDELSASMKKRVDNFRSFLKKIEEKAENEKPSDVLKFIIEKSGLKTHLENGDDEDKERLGNIGELVTLAGKYDSLPQGEGIEKLLEESALATKEEALDEKESAPIKLLTAHSAKGLEFDNVFVSGLEEDLFPLIRDSSQTKEEAEEERRLFYVAVTRAKKRLFLSYASSRTVYGNKEWNSPSQFLHDVEKHLDTDTEERPITTVYLD